MDRKVISKSLNIYIEIDRRKTDKIMLLYIKNKFKIGRIFGIIQITIIKYKMTTTLDVNEYQRDATEFYNKNYTLDFSQMFGEEESSDDDSFGNGFNL